MGSILRVMRIMRAIYILRRVRSPLGAFGHRMECVEAVDLQCRTFSEPFKSYRNSGCVDYPSPTAKFAAKKAKPMKPSRSLEKRSRR